MAIMRKEWILSDVYNSLSSDKKLIAEIEKYLHQWDNVSSGSYHSCSVYELQKYDEATDTYVDDPEYENLIAFIRSSGLQDYEGFHIHYSW